MSDSEFIVKVRQSQPIVWVKSHEGPRVISEYTLQISKLKVKDGDKKYQAFSWDAALGLQPVGIKNSVLATGEYIEKTAVNPSAPLEWLEKADDNTILFLNDFNFFLQPQFSQQVLVISRLKTLISKCKPVGKVIVIIHPTVHLPIELEKWVHVLDFELPTRAELKTVLKGVCESAGFPYPSSEEENLLDAALGMSAFEAESAFSSSLIKTKKFDPILVRHEKSAVVKKTGLLEVVESNYTLDDIGGLENFKAWLSERKNCFSPKAKTRGIRSPKGVLLVGVPGSGKSLSAKAVASVWNRPLLRLDMGRVFGSYVGESETNMQKCLDIAAAVSPCVLWIDELEKNLAGNKAGHDSQTHEVTRRVFQLMLTWMQERTADVFLVATANSVESLPPELLRAGRIDGIFWVDLPDSIQREEILKIHLKKVGMNPTVFDAGVPQLMKACEGFTGAEIEEWVQKSLVRAFGENDRDSTVEDFLATAPRVSKISKLMKDDIENARKWAEEHGTELASIVHEAPKKEIKSVKLNLN